MSLLDIVNNAFGRLLNSRPSFPTPTDCKRAYVAGQASRTRAAAAAHPQEFVTVSYEEAVAASNRDLGDVVQSIIDEKRPETRTGAITATVLTLLKGEEMRMRAYRDQLAQANSTFAGGLLGGGLSPITNWGLYTSPEPEPEPPTAVIPSLLAGMNLEEVRGYVLALETEAAKPGDQAAVARMLTLARERREHLETEDARRMERFRSLISKANIALKGVVGDSSN